MPAVWAQQAWLSLWGEGRGGGVQASASPVHKQAQQRKQQVFQTAVCPRAAAQEGKCVLGGEVAATNTHLRNTVGKIHQPAGLWGRGSPGAAHRHHSLLLCALSQGGEWLLAGVTLGQWSANRGS